VKQVHYLILAWLWAGCIAILSLIPAKIIKGWSWSDLLTLDKLAHAGVYALLIALFVLGSEWSRRRPGALLGVLVSYGILLEWGQGLMYLGRHFDILDIIANIIGLIAGLVLALRYIKSKSYDGII
jgi:glycopeptide antibiotics resistance protein